MPVDQQKIDHLIRRLNGLTGSGRESTVPAERSCDVFITPVEVNDSHGTGVLLRMLFGGEENVISIRSLDQYSGRQNFGLPLKIVHGADSRDAAFARVERAMRGFGVRRVVCVPYQPDDVLTAIAIHGIFGASMCTYIMDDQNIAVRGIEDGAMRELLEKSSIRLAISPEMRAGYEQKFGLPFFYLPPMAPARLLPSQLHVPVTPPDARHGVIIGNLWSPRWPDLLRRTVRNSGVTLSYPRGDSLNIPAEDLRADGIFPHARLEDEELVRMLRSMWFAVLPSGTLDQFEDRRWMAEFSLPSRLVYLMSTSHIPVIVLGSRDTAASHFVEQFGIGVTSGYDRVSFKNAVDYITQPEVNLAMRRRGLAAAGRFVDTGVGEWIWQSLERREPFDGRFEELMPERMASAAGVR
jgi:hypothetical protein